MNFKLGRPLGFLAALTLTAATLAATGPAGASASAVLAVPKIALGVRSVIVQAGSTAEVPVQFATRKGPLQWTTVGLPRGVTAAIACPSARRCNVTLRALASVFASTPTTVELVFSSVGAETRLAFLLAVQSPNVAPAPTLAPVATLPPTTVAAAEPNTVARAAFEPFTMRADNLVATGLPGGDTAFRINLARSGWSGPISLVVETTPLGFRAAFSPVNPIRQDSTTLILSAPSSAANADFPVKVIATSASARAELTLVARIRFPQIALTAGIPTPLTATGTTQYALDARSVDEPGSPVTLSIESVPSGVTVAFSSNPAIGGVLATLTVAASVAAGSYAFNFVGTRGLLVTKTAAVLVVPPRVVFTFTPTLVANSGSKGYGLSAIPASVSIARGTGASFDVTVGPTGGFVDPIFVTPLVPAGFVISYGSLGPNLFRVSVTAPSTAPVGYYEMTLQTSSGTVSASLLLGITVT